jgi:hypothetical protein
MDAIDSIDSRSAADIGVVDGNHREISASEPMCRVLICSERLSQETPMTESQKLSVLRDKLIRRRRALVAGLQGNATDTQPSDDNLVRIQYEIEAVERAMAEEKRAEFRL